MKRKYNPGTLALLLALFHGFAQGGCPADAPTAAPPIDPAIHLSAAQAASFKTTLEALSQQAHVAFVAEGQPLHPFLTPDQARHLALDTEGDTFVQLVDAVAAAYDYRDERVGPVFRLKKRYSDAEDLPDVTLEECYLDAEDAQALIDRFAPELGDGAPTVVTVRPGIRLSPAQTSDAQSGVGVPVTALPPDQQEGLKSFLLRFADPFPRANVVTAISYLKSLTQADPLFCRRDLAELTRGGNTTGTEGVAVFGFVEPTLMAVIDGKRQMAFSPLSNPSGGGDAKFTNGAGRGLVLATDNQHRFVKAAPDPSDPLPPPQQLPPAPALAAPLRQIVAALTPRVQDGVPLAVEDALAAKRALVVGDRYAAPTQIMDALAAVYGLRVRAEDPYHLRTAAQGVGRLVLSRPRPDMPEDLTGLGPAVKASLPDALMRDLDIHRNDIHAAAVRELRTATEPKIQASADGQVALSALTDRERVAFADATGADLAQDFGDWGVGGNPYINRFQEITLVGNSYRGPSGKSYGLFMKIGNGPDSGNSLDGPVGSLDPPAATP